MLHRREHDKQLTENERAKLLAEGASAKGMVLHNEPSPADRGRSQVRVEVSFKDNLRVEFNQELANVYQPDPDSPGGQRLAQIRQAQQLRHADHMPKIQLQLSDGSMVPVRYDATNRNKVLIDEAALQQRALHDYIESEQKPKEQKASRTGAVTGPPWDVPTHCPNCGAPVDQAKASRDSDPRCPFCEQPIPVKPIAS